MKRAMFILDHILMGRVFQPIAHYMNYRWHMNHFRLALYCLQFGLVCQAAGTFASWLQSESWLRAMSFGISLFNVWIARDWLRDLPEMSADFERDPTLIPRKARGFVFALPWFRAGITCVSLGAWLLLIAPAALTRAFGLELQALYLPMLVCLWYFAGVIPSGRSRKPKKQRAPAFPLEPVTAR